MNITEQRITFEIMFVVLILNIICNLYVIKSFRWSQAHELLLGCNIKKSWISQIVSDSRVHFR